ncbi:MAG: TauD/TfdA family dioxygenase [Alphaproteobacteria bacterium]
MTPIESLQMTQAQPLGTPRRRPVEGPAAWVGADMRRREAEWTHPLSPAEIAEIEQATRAVRARGLDLAAITSDDFPLPTLGPVLDRLRVELVEGRGFVRLRGMPVEDRPIEESATAYWGVGAYFGKARSQNAKGHLLGHVYDLGQGLSAENPNLRSYATAERQNFHIDRCDLVALLCLKRAKAGGQSMLVSAMTLHNVMAERRPDLLERLYRPVPVDRRGEVPVGKEPFYEAPVFNEYAGRVSILYSRLHIGSAQRFPGARRLTPEDIEALDMLQDLAGDPELRLDMSFMPGDLQILNNHTMLHARTGYEDWPEPEKKRHLLRLWLCPPDGRKLPPVFAECYGGVTVGDRGGIICKDTRLHAPLVPA